MSDFFSALAARVVQRSGDVGPPPVRPRLPALFETAPSGLGEEPGDRFAVAPPARSAPAPPFSDPAPSAPNTGRADEDRTPIHRPPLYRPPAGAPPPLAPAAPVAGAPTATLTQEPPFARIGQVGPEARASPSPTKPSMAEAAEVRAVVEPAAPSPPEATRAVASDRSEPPAAPAAQLGTPPPPAALARRIAEGAPPKGLASPPPAATTIEVSIGRIEVRAAPAPVERRAASAASPVMSLEDYLKSRPGRPAR
jgi:hypothetical protein